MAKAFTLKGSVLILYLCFLFNTNISIASNQGLNFKHLSVENGLSQSWVMCIEQDSLGFMWFGTSNGLNKFDGYNFTTYTHDSKNNNDIISNHVQALAIDKHGNLWVGTNGGLCMYNLSKDTFSQFSKSVRQSVNSLVISGDILYAGTSDGMFAYNMYQHEVMVGINNQVNEKLVNERINAIEKGNDGTILIGTSQGLYLYKPTTYECISFDSLYHTDNFNNLNIRAIEVDKENRFWVGTAENGLYLVKIDSENQVVESANFKYSTIIQSGINDGRVHALKVDKKNKLWIGIENGGVNILDLNDFDSQFPKFEHILNDASQPQSISNNSIYSIFEDKRGDMWIGTYGGGVNFYNNDGENFKVLRHIHNEHNSLINNIVNVIEKENDNLWVGTEGGISIIDIKNNRYQHIIHDESIRNGLSSNAIWSIHIDADNIWVGTWAGGLNKINKNLNRFTHFYNSENDESSLGSNNIFALTKDADNELWAGTLGGGIIKYDMVDNTASKVIIDEGLDNSSLINEVRHLYFNHLHEMWFSTSVSVGFINAYGDIHHFFPNDTIDNSFKGNGAYVIFEDSKLNMWCGSDAGLNCFIRADSSFKNYSSINGLTNNSIKSIQEDKRGNLWFGTNKGLFKFKDAVLIPNDPIFKKFDVSDGLQGDEFNRRASFKDKNGVMYFGGPKGLTYFNPDSIIENTTIPEVVFTDFLIFNHKINIGDDSPLKKNICLTDELSLKHSQTVFTLHYAALNFIGSEKNSYAYILEGFEPNWNYVDNKKSATYTNLNPGEYYFKVKAANNDGFWSERPTTLKITILPPWYKTRWALLAYFILLFSSIYTFISITQRRFRFSEALKIERLQRDQEKELNQQRLQFFTNISHEFRTPLTLIYSPIENILKNNYQKLPVEVKGQLSTIYKNALRLNRLATELMDFRKLQFNKLNMRISQQDICAFARNVSNLFSEEAELNRIILIKQIPDKPIFLWYDQSMIEKVLFNLLSNAFKVTAENGSITIKVEQISKDDNGNVESGVKVSVADTGPGLNQEQISKIFERFYQADNITKTYYSSTGIGLSLAKSLMEKHSGDISVDSKPGEGAMFTVWLKDGNAHFSEDDLKKAPKEVIEPEPNPLPKIEDRVISNIEVDTSVSILVVEDNRELRNYLAGELQKYYKVIEAPNGKVGIELAEKHMPDVVVSDVLMPELDGIQLCKAIKGNDNISHIPIILLTARAAIDDQIEGTEAGADAYIIKPFNPDLLKSRISQLLQSRKILFSKFSADLKIIPEINEFTNYDKNFLTKVTDYVIENISDSDMSVEAIGEKMHLSRSQFYRKIKSLSGHSATEFIRIIRLEQARKLILYNKISISEVGYKVGFSTPSYFTKCYKEHFGKLPSEE